MKQLQKIIDTVKDTDEKELLKRIMDLGYRADRTYSITYTDFVDSFLLGKIKSHRLEMLGFNILTYGGFEEAERQIIALGHSDLTIETEDFPIRYLKVSVNTGIGKPVSHRDFLGAIMGLGIEREKIGDLLINGSDAYIAAHEEIAEYILYTLESVSRYGKVTSELIEKEDIPHFEQEYMVINDTVSSLRVDAILASGFKKSRSSMSKLIAAQKAMCNGMIINQAHPIEEGDICTLRGYGKLKVAEVGTSKTRKGRTRIKIYRYI